MLPPSSQKVPKGGKTETFSPTMERNNKRSGNPRVDKRLQNPTLGSTISSLNPQSAAFQQRTKPDYDKRGGKHAGNGCDSKSESRKWRNHKQYLHKGEKGKRAIQTNNQLETTVCFYTPQNIQNGNLEKCEGSAPKRRSTDKNRPKKCLLCSKPSKGKQKTGKVSMGRKPLRIHVSRFRARPSPRIFTKILKVPVTILRKMKIRLVIYIDDMLIFAKSQQELEMARDAVLFLLQNLGFVINWEKSVLIPTKTMEFLGVTINSEEMTFSIPDQKMQKIICLCEQATQSSHLSVRNLASIVGKLMSTAQAFSPAPLQVRYLQNLLRGSLKSKSYESMISLSPEAHLELLWWKENLALHNAQGRPLKIQPPEMIITSDAAGGPLGGWGASCQGLSTGGAWSLQEKKLHINILEMIAAELAIKTFTKGKTVKSIHLQVDNTTALKYIVKMGGTKNQTLIAIAKRIWEYLLSNAITLTVEYIPSKLNTAADWESRNTWDSSEWKLDPVIFRQICQILGKPQVDLFASRVSHQLPRYMSRKKDPICEAQNALLKDWSRIFPYAFPPFNLIDQTLKKC